MSARPVKRSLTLRGHRTSVSLEDDFWQGFREIAREQGLPINVLAARVDAERSIDTGLATAIRLHVLAHYRARARGGGDPERKSARTASPGASCGTRDSD